MIETIVFIFGLIGIGFICVRLRLLGENVGDALTQFAVTLAIPMLLFRTMTRADFHGAAPWALWGTYFPAAAITWIAAYFIMTRIFARDSKAGMVAGMTSAFSNLALLGLPFALEVFGPEGVEILTLVLAIHFPVALAALAFMFAWFDRQQGQNVSMVGIGAGFVRQLLTNSLILGVLAGLAWRMTGFALPGVVDRLVNTFAGIGGPVALFAVGMSLQRFGLKAVGMQAVVAAALKLVLMPAATLVIALLVGLPPFAAKVAVVMAGLPAGVNPYLVASRFGVGQHLASNALTLSTAFAPLTIVFWVMVTNYVF